MPLNYETINAHLTDIRGYMIAGLDDELVDRQWLCESVENRLRHLQGLVDVMGRVDVVGSGVEGGVGL